ncbi:Retrovirus-related Pol polyprotein from transposon TNT 1-94 [Gossypium australe]|uniref:Retrovirus-related Pol polyprotein from transposon TNT 1-94 n=1 Tax=Gossypium australe TaxID=47621 RepID=A0A5B6X287_9ROSI|nr:Retrovirus-related Pol polyprotein from transposon TNT 1-94 [Gossypium australe]
MELFFHKKSVVKKFKLENAKAAKMLMVNGEKLSKDEKGMPRKSTYRCTIGSILYLTTSRPNLSFSVRVCARYHASPRESHVKTMKRITRYVHETTNLGISFSNDNVMSLVGYSDVDRPSNIDDRKSTSSGYFYIGSNLVS